MPPSPTSTRSFACSGERRRAQHGCCSNTCLTVRSPTNRPISRVGAVPQAPRGVTRRTEPHLVTAPLPRARPDYRPQPETAQRAEPDAAIPEPEERPGGRDPLVVY